MSRQDQAEFAEYLRHCEDGFDGSFSDWQEERFPEESLVIVVRELPSINAGSPEECPF